MNQAIAYAALGAALGYFNSKTKAGRKKSLVKGAALGYAAVAFAAPRLGITLPRINLPAARTV